MFAAYQVRPNLAFRVAYDVMYVTGIAIPPQNLGLGPVFPELHVEADALFHGASFGVEKVW